jgi:heat-inducible transcriptional repressor
VPTDLGYRFFIESLMPDPSLMPEEQLTVSHQFQQAQRDTAQWLRLAASTLARLSAEASIVTPPAGTTSVLKHIDVVPIQDRRVLLVAVLEGGAVRQQLLDLEQPAQPDELRAIGQRLTDEHHGGNSASIAAVVTIERGPARQIAQSLSRMLAETEAARAHDVYYDGIQNILAQPEFGLGDPARLREMVALLEDRTRVAELLPPGIGEGEVHVAIGYVGIVGPRRMDYARSIGAVTFIGRLMTDLVRAVEGN